MNISTRVMLCTVIIFSTGCSKKASNEVLNQPKTAQAVSLADQLTPIFEYKTVIAELYAVKGDFSGVEDFDAELKSRMAGMKNIRDAGVKSSGAIAFSLVGDQGQAIGKIVMNPAPTKDGVLTWPCETNIHPDVIADSFFKKCAQVAQTIPASLVTYEFSKNQMRAKDIFGVTQYNIVGVFDQAGPESKGGYKAVIAESWDSSSYVYAHLPDSSRADILTLNKGDLAVATCAGLDTYGTSPYFVQCDNLRPVDTGGERADLYLDKLIYDNNELLGNKPNL